MRQIGGGVSSRPPPFLKGESMKLNIASGGIKVENYTNYDGDLEEIPFSNVKELRASHILEHFGTQESIDILRYWISLLDVGGTLKIAVPDFDEIIRRRNLGYELPWEEYLMGGQVDKRDYHKSIWTHEKLRFIMSQLGLVCIRTWQSNVFDCASLPISLNLEGLKSE
jgi:hypothetical protein